MRRYHFKFRAELESDVDALIKLLPQELSHTIKIKFIQPPLPDVEVDLYTPLTLKDVRYFICQIENGHVMLETLTYHTQYTGNRNPNITCP